MEKIDLPIETMLKLFIEKDCKIDQLEKELVDAKDTVANLTSLVDAIRYDDPKLSEMRNLLETMPKTIVGAARAEFYNKMVVEGKKLKFNEIDLILDTVLADYVERINEI